MPKPACEEFQQSVDLLFDPKGGEEAQAKLLDHLERCADCTQVFELVGRLRSADMHADPSDAEFLAMRRGVLRGIRRSQSRMPGLLARLGRLFHQPAFALSFSVLLAGTGFIAGRNMGTRSSASQESWTSPEDAMVSQIKLVALKNRGAQDFERAPYTYENVKVDDEGSGKVALSFDVSRHVALSLPKSDPMVTEVLIQTLVSPSPVGTKLRAISYAGSLLEPKVRKGLIKAMLSDPNLGVRLKAQSRLIDQDADPEVKEALLRVLQNEESVQMKLVAIDSLTRHKIDPNRIRQALAPAEKGNAVYIKAMNYLNENGGTL